MGSQANPVFECEYEASALNQGPNQVRGTETSTMNTMNRGLLVAKNWVRVYARPNTHHGTDVCLPVCHTGGSVKDG